MRQLKDKLENWNFAAKITIVREKYLTEIDASYIRMRARLKNNDLLEISEYIVVIGNQVTKESYSYHWQDSEGNLISRWDNAPHHPKVTTFPHHVHSESESNIAASGLMSLEKVIEQIEQTLNS